MPSQNSCAVSSAQPAALSPYALHIPVPKVTSGDMFCLVGTNLKSIELLTSRIGSVTAAAMPQPEI